MTKETIAKLYAHVENDAHLQGTYNLQGIDFDITARELHNYLQYRKKHKQPFPESYLKIVQDMEYLIEINAQLKNIKNATELCKLTTTIADKICSLEIEQRILLSGGWPKIGDQDGHGLIYKITHTQAGYHFSLINSGAGLKYHHKKSALHKELYSPIMTWSFPAPSTEREKAELGFFIQRLLGEKIAIGGAQPNAERRLYKEILPSICHIDGKLVEPNSLPDFAYTSGQISGTCAESGLHKLLKIDSPSEKEYVNFIFDYKVYIQNYAEEDKLTLTNGMKEQINLAIQNNLKIVNNPKFFSFEEIENHANQLNKLAEKNNARAIPKKRINLVENDAPKKLFIEHKSAVAPKPNFNRPDSAKNLIVFKPLEAKDFLANLGILILEIGVLHESAFSYYYLEQLVLDLSMDLNAPLYAELKTEDYSLFAVHLDRIQKYLSSIQNKYLKEAQDPLLNLMVLKIMTLQMHVQREIAKSKKHPDFSPFVQVVIHTIIANTHRNPFWATNHPVFTKIFKELQNNLSSPKSHQNYYDYYKTMLASNKDLDQKLRDLFKTNYGLSSLEIAIQKNGLQSLYMISLHLSGKCYLGEEFKPLIQFFTDHLSYESKLRAAINPFFKTQLSTASRFEFILNKENNELLLYTPLYPSFIAWQVLSDKLMKPSYPIADSPALKALAADTSTVSAHIKKIDSKTANNIQLKPIDTEDNKSRAVTQADIAARDYLHLRSEPQFQIVLTLDYFTRHIDKLANQADQFYVEANLMQPGLLEKSHKDKAFLPQFEVFLKKGLRFFNKNGLYSSESLFFLRLNFLVSRYFYLLDNKSGLPLLQAIEEQLTKQLSQPNDLDLVYVQKQYLFLTLMTQAELSIELFTIATETYFYLQSHSNPNKEQALSHQLDIEKAIIKFQLAATQLSQEDVELVVKTVLAKEPKTKSLTFKTAEFPLYFLENEQQETLEFNLLLGKLFEKNMARTSLPITIKNHPLIQHLDLQNKQSCLMSSDMTYMVLPDPINEVQLFHIYNRLLIQKKWQLNGSISNYELHALTKNHLAKQASYSTPINNASLPAILKDGSMDYWQDTDATDRGLLVKNNKALYFYNKGELFELDEQARQTEYRLENLESKWYAILNAFESNEFIISLKHPSNNTVIKLPRYNLNFIIDHQDNLKLEETEEQVIERPWFIPTALAGLTLKVGNYLRFLTPRARFYPTDSGIQLGDFYAMQHDTTGKMATTFLDNEWKKRPPLNQPLWDYQNSEKYLSFRIEKEGLRADNVADALYLAYLYLSTNQPKNAWKILGDCDGGLTGNPAELEYITWIYESLPKEFPHAEEAYIETPPYVACRLKALSLLSDYLLQDKNFELVSPELNTKANSHYDLIQHTNLVSFLTHLPEHIYQSYADLQKMNRYLEQGFNLSSLERKRLLDYYYKKQPKNAARGALGYEWMCLSLETLQREGEALEARISTTNQTEADLKRLTLIKSRLSKMKPILAKSTILKTKSIDLSLPSTFTLNKTQLSQQTVIDFENWSSNLRGTNFVKSIREQAVNSLSSAINENDFIRNFPALFSQAWSLYEDDNGERTKRLSDFCTKTLIAKRHVPLEKQDSNIPFLCNVLYRVLSHKWAITTTICSTTNFNDLLVDICKLTAPKIQVYQAKDVYEDILAKPEDILRKERLKSKPLVTKKLEKTSLLEQLEIKNFLNKKNRQALDELISNYRSCYKKGTEQIALAETEAEAGKARLALAKVQKKLGQTLLENKTLVLLLQDLFQAVEEPIKDRLNKAWELTLKFANQGPDEPEKRQTWNLEKQSKTRAPLGPTDLQSIFCRADLSYSVEKTGLSSAKIQALHELIHDLFFIEIQAQLIKKMRADLELAFKESNPYLSMQILDLLAKEQLPGLDDPVTVLIQKEENIVLRPRQTTALNSLLQSKESGRGAEEKIEKVKPGDGKTKVIGPILAEKLAQGDNLVIFEVPIASLKTNHVDSNCISKKLFGKRAYLFEFDRDSNCSPNRLEEIYNLFIEIMVSRCYMITTGDSIQALELKYIEFLLKEKKEREPDWSKQVYWLDKITHLLRHYADAFIDEVHLGLSFKKKLIYTIGESKSISPTLIQYSLALYSYIDINFIKNAPKLPKDYDWLSFKENLVERLLSDSLSPLNPFFKQALTLYGSKVKQELIDYILDRAKSMPEAIIHASADNQSVFAFFKQQVSAVIQNTLCNKLNVKYGASELSNLSALESTVAIPYKGNMSPNEQSRFGHELVAINHSIQMFLIKGISKELLIDQIKAWQALARQELAQNSNFKQINDTPTAKGFALLEGNSWSLADFDVNDESQISALHEKFKDNQNLQFLLLKDRSLAQIQHESGFLQSDSFNHADIYRSTLGASGTPGEGLQRLEVNKKASLGTDDYVIELLVDKKTALSHYDYNDNAEQFLQTIIKNSKNGPQTRAIIDINATFTGLANLEVAQTIANFVRKNPGSFSHKLNYVLYFNQDQILSALDINNPKLSILLQTSDEKEISLRLRCKPEERFTYYDQIHTLGSDIKQYKYAHALVLIDENVHFTPFVQGNLRIRDLDQEQTNELILPTRVKGIRLIDLASRLKSNEEKELPQENLFAAKAEMANLMRRSTLTMIQDLASESAVQKAFLAQQFNCFLKETASQDLFALYGAIAKEEPIADIFDRYKKQLLELWQDCHKKAKLELTPIQLQDLELKLQDLIKKAKPHCLKSYKELVNSAGKEIQIQKMVQKQIEQVELKACFDSNLTEATELNWYHYPKAAKDTLILDLNNLCSSNTLFSKRLNVSKNYAYTYVQQRQNLNAFMKPVFMVWYHFESNDSGEKILEATIVTPQEVNALYYFVNHNRHIRENDWISTVEDTLVKGQAPENITQQKEYQSLREQIRFFNGDFTSLLEQTTALIWIPENTEEKINFFESELKIYRAGCELGFYQLKTALSQVNTEGFNYLAANPFMDHKNTDWKTIAPKSLPSQITEFVRTAEAFQYINEHWLDKKLVFGDIEQQFGLTMSSFGYVNDHLHFFSSFKKLMEEKIYAKQPFLQYLESTDEPLLESFLGISLASFYKQQAINPLETDNSDPKWLDASLAAVNILSKHPALKTKNNFLVSACHHLALAANTPEFLFKLLKKKPSNPVIDSILRNKYCNESIMQAILDLRPKLHDDAQFSLAKQCTPNLIDSLLQIDLNQVSLLELCKHNFLTTKHLSLILSKVKSEAPLPLIFEHSASTPTIQEAVVKHPSCTNECLIDLLIQSKLTKELCLKILAKPKFSNESLLLAMAKQFNSSEEIQLAILACEKYTQNVIHAVIDSEAFSPKIAQQLIICELYLPADYEIDRLLKRILENYSKSPQEWEKILVELIDLCLHISHIDKIKPIILKNSKLITPSVGIAFFNRFGSSLFNNFYFYLPFEGMLAIADNKTLKKLVNQKETGKLSDSRLLLLFKKCSQENLLGEFFKRQDIHFKVINEILQNPADYQLTENQLLAVLENINDSSTVSLIYDYKNANDQIRDKLLESKFLSSDFLLELTSQKELTNPQLIKLLSSGISLTPTIIQNLLANPELTPEMALLIAQNYKSNSLLIAKLAFESLKKDPKWELCLLEVFKQLKPTSKEALFLKPLITEKGCLLSIQTAFQILAIYGEEMEFYLPLENLAAVTQSELEILLNSSSKLSEKMELWLVSRCETNELINLYLKKPVFSEKALLTLLEKENLDHLQLKDFAFKTKSPEVLEQIHNHKAALDCNKQLIYTHDCLTSDLLDRLKTNDADWLLLLQHLTTIDKKVLTKIARTTQSEDVLAALINHKKLNDSILAIAIENANFSCQLANSIIKNNFNSPQIRATLIKKAFGQTRMKKTASNDWLNYLNSALIDYSQFFNKQDLINIFKEEQIQNPELGFILFQHYGQELIDQLPLEAMIDIAYFRPERLRSLARNLIAILLDRQDSDPKILQIILTKNISYKNLQKALRHPNLTNTDRQHWVESLRDWQASRKNSVDPDIKLLTSLDALRLKACEHAVKAVDDDNYKPVAEAAITLYNQLYDKVDCYLTGGLSKRDCRQSCNNAIEAALPILGTHRGYKLILADIINVLLNVFTFKFAWSKNWRFFEPKTATVETIDEFKEERSLFT